MKYDLHPSFRVLTHTPKFESTELFGMNLGENMRDILEAQRVGNRVTRGLQYNKPKQFLRQTAVAHLSPSRTRAQPRQRATGLPEIPGPEKEKLRQKRARESEPEDAPQVKKVCMDWENFVDHAIATGIENTKAFKAG